jgi:hypothetical protein
MSHGVRVILICWFAAALGVPQALGQPARKVTDQPPHPERQLADATARILWFGTDHPLVAQSESAAMLAAIVKGGSMGDGDGWFRPGSSRYGWPWLAARHGIGATERITRSAWRGPPEIFDRLDRNHDGDLTAADFDWSETAAATREERIYRQWFSKIDADANGKISRKEWESLFEKLAAGKDYLNVDDLRQAFPMPSAIASSKGPKKSAKQGMTEEFRQTLLKGLFQSELGSPFEGPRIGQDAPDFTLPTHDGKHKITLSDYRGSKPVVLIFGSFT